MRRWRCPAVGFGNWVPPPLVCADRRGPGSFRGRRLGGRCTVVPGAPNTATATSPPPSCPTAAPRPPRPTGSACTSRPPARVPRCRTPGSMTRTATAARSRTSSAPGRFLLIAGEDGQAWCDAARELAAEAGLPLDAVRIGHLDGDYHDPRCAWQRHRQIASDGAVLVRPDRFIAWRHPAGASHPRAVLAAALSQILARPVGRVASPARPRPLSQQPPSGPLAGVPHHPPARP